MKNLFLLLILASSFVIQAQELVPKDTTSIFNFAVVEQLPVFKDCDKNAPNSELMDCMNTGIISHISKNFKYPVDARKAGTQGKIYVNFVVEKNGSISNVSIARGVSKSLDAEAVRVIKLIPKFKRSAIQKGKPVRMQYTIPINAVLN